MSLGDLGENGVQLRPHIVFFGEAVPKLEEAAQLVSRADLLLIVGTSFSVYPAASLYAYAPAHTPIYVIDPVALSLPEARMHHIRKTAVEGMKDFTEILKSK